MPAGPATVFVAFCSNSHGKLRRLTCRSVWPLDLDPGTSPPLVSDGFCFASVSPLSPGPCVSALHYPGLSFS